MKKITIILFNIFLILFTSCESVYLDTESVYFCIDKENFNVDDCIEVLIGGNFKDTEEVFHMIVSVGLSKLSGDEYVHNDVSFELISINDIDKSEIETNEIYDYRQLSESNFDYRYYKNFITKKIFL